jgi:hypothetical protein
MNENGWKYLKTILSLTDNGDINSTNKPLHAYLHYHHRLESVKNKLWKNPKLSEWVNGFITGKEMNSKIVVQFTFME